MHLKPQTQLPAQTLASIVPEFADPQRLAEFDAKVMAENAANAQRRLFKDALKSVIGLKPGQWFRKMDANSSKALALGVPEKLLLRKRASHSEPTNMQTVGDLGLLDLFT